MRAFEEKYAGTAAGIIYAGGRTGRPLFCKAMDDRHLLWYMTDSEYIFQLGFCVVQDLTCINREKIQADCTDTHRVSYAE